MPDSSLPIPEVPRASRPGAIFGGIAVETIVPAIAWVLGIVVADTLIVTVAGIFGFDPSVSPNAGHIILDHPWLAFWTMLLAVMLTGAALWAGLRSMAVSRRAVLAQQLQARQSLAAAAALQPTPEQQRLADLRRMLESRSRRLTSQSAALIEITRSQALADGDIGTILPQICNAIHGVVPGVSVSVWLVDEAAGLMRVAILVGDDELETLKGLKLRLSKMPRYLEVLQLSRGIATNNAPIDPRTNELVYICLLPLGIVGLIDVGIRVGGRIVGALCLDHPGTRGHWTTDERNFVASMADLASVAMEAHSRREAMAQLALARDEAERANRSKGDFLANISHELRTPLNAIMGFTELMEAQPYGPLGDPRYSAYLGDIHLSANHLLGVINGILDMAKAESGEIELAPEPVPVGPLIEEACRVLAVEATRQGLELTLTGSETLPLLLADPLRLRQAFLNILSNAIKFNRRGGKVNVNCHVDREGKAPARNPFAVVIEVSDTGVGIKEADISRVFEPFVQVDASFSRRFQGTGLGLPLAKFLIEAHGGTITMESTPEVGTTVTLRLPLIGAVAQTKASATIKVAAGL